MNPENLKHIYRAAFGSDFERAFFSPGRVNLIGEHIDYNGGNVLPCALGIGTYGAASRRDDRLVKLYSADFPDDGVISLDLDALANKPENGWGNYVAGMLKSIRTNYDVKSGFNLAVEGDLPKASGLSSSASLEMLVGCAVNTLFGLDIPGVDMALLGKKTENEFVGVNSGIMDQFAVQMGKKDHAVYLNCNDLRYEYIPLELGDCELLIINSNKPRALTDSKYNERFDECMRALGIIRGYIEADNLVGVGIDWFERNKGVLGDDVLIKRTSHVLYENQRTVMSVRALKGGDLKRFGEYLNESHASMRDLYEITGPELDSIAHAAQRQRGVLGARMTGGGFGGCAIAIVAKDEADDVIKNVGEAYTRETGYTAGFYTVKISGGPGAINI